MAYGYVTFAPTFALATRESIGRTRPAMDGLASTDSCGDAISHWWRGPAANKVLLMAGVAAVVVYAVGDVLRASSTTGTATRIRRSVSSVPSDHRFDP